MPSRLSKGEILLAGVLALAVYTALLIQMPYRPPLVNTLLSGMALAALYSYLKFRFNIRLPFTLVFCLVVSVVLDIIGNQFGLFSHAVGFIPYDVFTHFMTSGLSCVVVIWLLLEFAKRFGWRLPFGVLAFFSVTTAFSLAAYYEILELWDERFLDGHRLHTPRDTPNDLVSDLVGIVVAAIIYAIVVKIRTGKLHTDRIR